MNDFYEGRMIPLKIADQAIINCNKEIEKLQIENDRLQSEVERLTKAGDAMAEELSACYREEGWEDTIPGWEAAKEGKKS